MESQGERLSKGVTPYGPVKGEWTSWTPRSLLVSLRVQQRDIQVQKYRKHVQMLKFILIHVCNCLVTKEYFSLQQLWTILFF